MADIPMSERQKRYFAAMAASLERDTGRSLAEWVAIARTCPETAPRARLRWFKEAHGLLQNRATHVIHEAFGGDQWDDPETLVAALWADAQARAVFEALDRATLSLDGALRTPRKAYTAWVRAFQFAAARPLKSGGVELGLALAPARDRRLDQAATNPPWSERLKSRLSISRPAEVGAVESLLRQAWDAS